MSEALDGPRVVCRVCTRQFSRYTCPRCNARYCSLSCYKKHSMQCTEAFYRDNAVEEMKGTTVDDEQRKAVYEILRRVHEQGDAEFGALRLEAGESGEDEEDERSFEEQEDDEEAASGDLNGLSEETMQRLLQRIEEGAEELSLEDLSPEDLQKFQRAVASGAISHLVEEWEPWWETQEARGLRLSASGTPLLVVEEEGGDASTEGGKGHEAAVASPVPPAPAEPLPALKKLLGSRDPSPVLQWHLLDILYAYCCAMRVYNGDWAADPSSAAALALALSAVLAGEADAGPDAAFSCGDVLAESVTRAAGHFGLGGGRVAAMRGCSDVSSIVGAGRGTLVCALWDMRRLLAATLQELEQPQEEREGVSRGEGTSVPGGGGAASLEDDGDKAGAAAAKSSRHRNNKRRDVDRGSSGKVERRRRKHLQAAQHKLLFFASWVNFGLSEPQLSALEDHARRQWEEMDAILRLEQQHRKAAASPGGGGTLHVLHHPPPSAAAS